MDKVELFPGLDHIANFINALDSEGMTGSEIRSAIYAECITPTRPATTIEALQAQVAARDAALARAEKWLRACSDWLLETDLDMKCPDTMDEDPLDIADDIAALGQGEG